MYSWQSEERENIIFDLLGFFHGVVQEEGIVRGFGVCNHCQFADLEGESEDHPEGLGKITTGVNVNCTSQRNREKKLPEGLRLMGSGLEATKICRHYVPNICDLCNILEFRKHRECKDCAWNEE